MVSNICSKSCQSIESEWDKAIIDAKNELKDAERRVGRLKNAIRIFLQHKKDGVPWPSDNRVSGQKAG